MEELKEIIERLNKKYQVVIKNRYWWYDDVLKYNGKSISENDILLSLSLIINDNIISENKESIKRFIIPDIDYNMMKKYVLSFFTSIDSSYTKKVSEIFSSVNVIKGNGRSSANKNEINFYYENNIGSLLTLAHEVSHKLADSKDNAFKEIESTLTENLFLDYLIDNKLMIIDNFTNNLRALNEEDAKLCRLYDYNKNVLQIAYRAIDEIPFKKLMIQNNLNQIDENLIDIIFQMKNIPNNIDNKKRICKRIEMFIDEYYPKNNNYKVEEGYDLKDGKHLSNESRFIFSNCFLERFLHMNLNTEERKMFYKFYMDNVKNMNTIEILSMFNISVDNLMELGNDFIDGYNSILKSKKL